MFGSPLWKGWSIQSRLRVAGQGEVRFVPNSEFRMNEVFREGVEIGARGGRAPIPISKFQFMVEAQNFTVKSTWKMLYWVIGLICGISVPVPPVPSNLLMRLA